MSALPPKADIAESDWHVRFVPQLDIRHSVPSLQREGVAERLGTLIAVGTVGGFEYWSRYVSAMSLWVNSGH